jgi:hypothetical protein
MPGHPHGTLGEDFPEYHPDSKPLTTTEKGRLQRALEPVFKTAKDWDSLVRRLARRKYALRPQGRGLAIYTMPQGRHVCNTATIGYCNRALVKRFGAPMPGHPDGGDHIRSTVEDDQVFEMIERD